MTPELHSSHITGTAPGTDLLRLRGQAHQDTAALLHDILSHALRSLPQPQVLLVDCSRLTLCTPAGLHQLLTAHRAAYHQGTALRLTGTSEQLRHLIHATGADAVLDLPDNGPALGTV
ncbi:STAS domain-containing protein [Kitasatospora sp. NPDC085895]|uniref:STAS domain-containing protein n=1 Tax=Kitasatospora sp. NPDC085895 TaxID=3155057 RepID=UPI00344B7326